MVFVYSVGSLTVLVGVEPTPLTLGQSKCNRYYFVLKQTFQPNCLISDSLLALHPSLTDERKSLVLVDGFEPPTKGI